MLDAGFPAPRKQELGTGSQGPTHHVVAFIVIVIVFLPAPCRWSLVAGRSTDNPDPGAPGPWGPEALGP
jgi:hypothetical protein